MNKPLTIWFDNAGNLLERNAQWLINRGAKSEIAEDFQDTLSYKELYEGRRTAARAVFISVNSGRKYSMFLDDFDKVIKNNKFIDNKIEGTFRFIKRGQAQAIKLLFPKVDAAP